MGRTWGQRAALQPSPEFTVQPGAGQLQGGEGGCTERQPHIITGGDQAETDLRWEGDGRRGYAGRSGERGGHKQ